MKVSYFTSAADYVNTAGSLYDYIYVNEVLPVSNSSKYMTDYDVCRGLLTREIFYNANGNIVKNTISNYNLPAAMNSTSPDYYELLSKAGYFYHMCGVACQQCFSSVNEHFCTDFTLNRFLINDTKIICPWIYKTSIIDTVYDTNGTNPIGVTTNYYYDNPTHGLVTRTVSLNSKGDTLTTVNKYASDQGQINGLSINASTALTSLVAMNKIASPIEMDHYKNRTLLDLTRKDYLIWDATHNVVEPQHIWYQTMSNPIEDRLDFYQYDTLCNIQDAAKSNGSHQAYIWDYKGQYLIAETKNAQISDVAYTSFEADGTGNWTISAFKLGTTGGLTGNNFDTLATGATISKSGLTAARTYLVTYWSKNGPATISGSTVTTGLVKKGWTFYQHTLAASSTSVSITGSGIILDELRLYPTDAQMTTYTYTPLVGMTSSCSVNSLTTYYEYDGLNRLLRIRDVDGNIIKQYDYQYQIPYTQAP
jgi:hypothetical protein